MQLRTVLAWQRVVVSFFFVLKGKDYEAEA